MVECTIKYDFSQLTLSIVLFRVHQQFYFAYSSMIANNVQVLLVQVYPAIPFEICSCSISYSIWIHFLARKHYKLHNRLDHNARRPSCTQSTAGEACYMAWD